MYQKINYFGVEELKKEFFDYFVKECGYHRIAGASLVPDVDDSVLYTPAGMYPLIPYLTGKKGHPEGNKLVNIQNVVRTGAINRVGLDSFLTFFELFGVWIINDYSKYDVLTSVWNFLTSGSHLGISQNQIYITYFEGNDYSSEDINTLETWKKIGIKDDYLFPTNKNWKGQYSDEKICGPNTRIYYDTNREKCSPNCNPLCNCGKYVELWDIVFFDYSMKDNVLKKSECSCVDMGAGVERLAALVQKANTIYETNIFNNIVEKVKSLQNSYSNPCDYEMIRQSRIVADHMRCATFIIGDDVATLPSNKKRAYVLRKILRRAINNCDQLGIDITSYGNIIDAIIASYLDNYPELIDRRNYIADQILREYDIYKLNLQKNILLIEKKIKNKTEMSEEEIKQFFDVYGVPVNKINNILKEKHILIKEKTNEIRRN